MYLEKVDSLVLVCAMLPILQVPFDFGARGLKKPVENLKTTCIVADR